MSISRDVTITWLAMERPPDRDLLAPLPSSVELRLIAPPEAATVSAALYREIGADWYWTDRRAWSDAAWELAVNRPDVELWTASIAGELVGYFELHVEPDAVELKYFGLRARAVGQGLGRALLSAAIDRAWALGRPRVTVNTCSLDHPAALANYRARGFAVIRTATEVRTLPG